jgi:uncharacterized protein (TIGR00369 family)
MATPPGAITPPGREVALLSGDAKSETGSHALTRFQPKDAAFESRVRESFARQTLMRTIGAELARVEPGRVEIALPYRPDLTQQHGYLHAGITSAIADSAGGYAGHSLFSAGSSVLTVEFKINLLAPAAGERFVALGEVMKPGRTLTICRLEVSAIQGELRTLIAIGQQTLICLEGQPDALGPQTRHAAKAHPT